MRHVDGGMAFAQNAPITASITIVNKSGKPVMFTGTGVIGNYSDDPTEPSPITFKPSPDAGQLIQDGQNAVITLASDVNYKKKFFKEVYIVLSSSDESCEFHFRVQAYSIGVFMSGESYTVSPSNFGMMCAGATTFSPASNNMNQLVIYPGVAAPAK